MDENQGKFNEPEMRARVSAIAEKYRLSLVLLFGSQASGTADKNSDYDFAVLLPDSLSKERRFELRLTLMGELTKILKKNVEVVILNDLSSLFFKYVIMREGKLLYQRREEDRLDFESRVLSEYFDFQPFLDQYNHHYVEANL